MLNKKRMFTFLLIFALSLPVPNILNSAELPVITVFADTISYLIRDITTISSSLPYVSAPFKPSTNHIALNYCIYNLPEQYISTCYIDVINNGSWTTLCSSNNGGDVNAQISLITIPGATYRIRITTTDPNNRILVCEVMEM